MSRAEGIANLKVRLLADLRAAGNDEFADLIAAWTDDETERRFRATAVHESGHALAAVRLGINFKLAAIDPTVHDDDVMMGYVEGPNLDPEIVAGKGEFAAMPYVLYLLAGPVAEVHIYGKEAMHGGSEKDRADAREFVISALHDSAPATEELVDRAKSLLHKCGILVELLVRDSLDEIKGLADLLLERRSLSCDEITKVIGGHAWERIQPKSRHLDGSVVIEPDPCEA
jgi:hypothetical protein